MTTTRSIFQKTCPACMTTLPLDATDCACGHQFDHDDADATLSSEEIRLKAEELYENYLVARAEQAASAVMTAQAEFAREPASAQKSQRVASAIQESEAARAALAAQSARVAEMKKALPKRAPAPRPAPTAAVPKMKVAAAKPVVAPSPARATAKSARNSDTDDAITTSLVSRRMAKKTASKTRPTHKPAHAPVAAKPEIIPPPAQTKTPNPAFRQAQAARAEKILRRAETAVAVKAVIKEETIVRPKPESRKNPAPAPVLNLPAPKPPKDIAAKAEIKETTAVAPRPELKKTPSPAPILTKSAPRLLGADKKECPNCTASVDNKLNRCRCGYEFPTSETLMPALAMSEEERAEFAKLFSFP